MRHKTQDGDLAKISKEQRYAKRVEVRDQVLNIEGFGKATRGKILDTKYKTQL